MNRFYVLCFMFFFFFTDAESNLSTDTVLEQIDLNEDQVYIERLNDLNQHSEMDLSYHTSILPFIKQYTEHDKRLISKMLTLGKYYFNIFEPILDKYNLPLELKYLAVVESSLNPKARSGSGATGLWQFMYLTGKQYNLNVTSYVDDRQDPIKSTEAACKYFEKLYEIFGDWNLVLAAYNGGPNYIQRKMFSTGINNYWDLQPHLRKETRNYIPKFIAINYAMNFAADYQIKPLDLKIELLNVDTITLRSQINIKVLEELVCVSSEIINHYNPSYKKGIFPKGSTLILTQESINDFLLNEQVNYNFVMMYDNKEILIDEKRILYNVKKGDYLGKIAEEHNIRVFEIKEWNKLKSSNLGIGDKLVLFVSTNNEIEIEEKKNISENEYVIKKGDTLWDIARELDGVSVWKLKSINNLDSDNLKPGTTIILPKS